MVADVKRLIYLKNLRHGMGENGRRYTEENNDIKVLVKKHIEVFKGLLGR
jgi:hypothetical protein